jgi:ABC-type transport system involved in cytochrome bd biosynthesis fused ATPase/permease subunit
MKVNEIIVEGPFSKWVGNAVGGSLQSLGQRLNAAGQRLGAQDPITAQTQKAALDQRVKAWLQAKQQYTTAGWNMQDADEYKKALDQWLAHQYNAQPVENFVLAVNGTKDKDYIAKSLAIKAVKQQTPTAAATPTPTPTTPAPSVLFNPATGRNFNTP